MLYIDDMDTLTPRIRKDLETKKYSVLFSTDVAKICPVNVEEVAKRNRTINAFAKANNWAATITDSGVRVSFRKIVQ